MEAVKQDSSHAAVRHVS